MARHAQAYACSTKSTEPCGALPVARDDELNESGCISAIRLAVAPRERELAPEAEEIAAAARRAGHDLNNLLAIITTYTLLVLEDIELGHPSRPDLEQVRAAAERARDVTRLLSELGQRWSSSVPPP